MIVCICNQVSDKTIRSCASAGLTFDDIQLDLGVATQCGQCECHARDVIRQCRKQIPCPQAKRTAQPPSPPPLWQPIQLVMPVVAETQGNP